MAFLALAVFAVLFLRLWALQVLAGDKYLAQANDNRVRTLQIDAPRGAVLDRNGHVLVSNVAGTRVELWPADLPKTWPAELRELRALETVTGVSVQKIVSRMKQHGSDPLTPIVVQNGLHQDQIFYLSEHRAQFPGVQLVESWLRSYPYRSTAAQVLGYVGQISAPQYNKLKRQGFSPNDSIGQAGVESSYDGYLRGRDGAAQLTVDSLGRPKSTAKLTALPKPGDALRLTLDVNLQRAAERALRYGVQLARANGETHANGGSIVALDPRDGSVLAMASYPTYQPSIFVGRPDAKKLAPLLNPAVAQRDNYPGINRALDAAYPPGSTFKPVTALAAMQENLLNPYALLPCTPTFTAYKQKFDNWTPLINTGMNLQTALAESCDTYFYELGRRFYVLPPDRGHPLQAWSNRFGLASPPASTSRRSRRADPDARVAAQDVRGLEVHRGRPHVEAGLLDPAGDRPGPGDDDPVADGALLCADRERRPAGDAARGRRRRADRLERPAREGAPALRRPAPAGTERRRRSAAQRAAGPVRGDARDDRHLVRGLRLLPRRDRGQDGQRREAHASPRLPEPREPDAIVVVRLRSVRRADDHGLRGDRERRPRRRRGRAGSAEGVRAVLPHDRVHHDPRERLMAIEAVQGKRVRGARESDVSGVALVRRLDWVLMGATAAAVAFGLWAIHGITLHDRGGSALSHQVVYAFAGGVLFLAVLFVDPDWYRRFRRPIYVATTGVMLLVLASGAASHGSKRWISLAGFTFQPSEFGKVLFILVIAGVLADRARSMNDVSTPLRAIGFGLVPILLVFVQPDIGTALVYTAGLVAVLFVAGVRWSHLAILAGIATVGALLILWLLPASGINVLKPYQTARLTGFTHPSSDPRGATYNLRQSITAVGAGGLRGRGILNATQTRLNYLPRSPPTSRSPRSPRSAASSASRSCCCSTC
jgi:Cell division protein FtsI/penicillin-binding protein 2